MMLMRRRMPWGRSVARKTGLCLHAFTLVLRMWTRNEEETRYYTHRHSQGVQVLFYIGGVRENRNSYAHLRKCEIADTWLV